jgi:formylglycine-generating enzyme required for sulfatase activity
MPFVTIPAGQFLMGGTAGEASARPVHTVVISRAFELGKHEVTQAQWAAVTGENPSTFAGCGDCPVETVAWPDVVSFLARLEALDPRHAYRLPTEAEWEHAARGGSRQDVLEDPASHAWYYVNASDRTHPVGTKAPNAWGLHDMFGNVFEWCSDWYDEGYYARSPTVDPPGPPSGEGGQLLSRPGVPGRVAAVPKHCVRGGDWNTSKEKLRASLRGMHRTEPGTGVDTLGLRLVRERR